MSEGSRDSNAQQAPAPGQAKLGWLRPATEYGPLVVFLLAYVLWGLMPATAALIAATAVALVLTLALERRLPMMPLITAAVVGVFGGLTLWLNDETFIKMKPTIVQALFAAVLLGGLAVGRPLLKALLSSALSLDDRGWNRLSLRWALFFLAMAGLNELVWRTQSTDFWVTFKVFGILGLTLVFALAQAPLLLRHRPADAAAKGDGAD
ncbi:MAG: septation protein A [Kiloniellales bacterium]